MCVLYVCMHACMHVCLSVRPSVRPSVSPSVRPSVCMYVCMYVCMFMGTRRRQFNRATSVDVRLSWLRKDLRMGSISRDVVNFTSELCRRRSGMFTEVARLVPPGGWVPGDGAKPADTQGAAVVIMIMIIVETAIVITLILTIASINKYHNGRWWC